MEITYIKHSGFLIEWETCYWLFDYYKGDIPEINTNKKVFVFVSHKHEDHFNPKIFTLYHKHKNITYILSSDIVLEQQDFAKIGVPFHISEHINMVKSSSHYEFYDNQKNRIDVETLKSTDYGVAFMIRYKGKMIYHAGDLNLWLWKGETKKYNDNMQAMFEQYISKLKDCSIDVAFAHLDPRQEEYYSLGMEYLLNIAKVKYVFPMHFWEKPEIIHQFIKEKTVNDGTTIMGINYDGQSWRL